MEKPSINIAIIGSGIAGMACAHRLKKLGFERITIFEKSNSFGGRMITEESDSIRMDTGAQFFLSNYKIIKQLHKEYNIPIKIIENRSFQVIGEKKYSYNLNSYISSLISIIKHIPISDLKLIYKLYKDRGKNVSESIYFKKLSNSSKELINAIFYSLTVQPLDKISLSMLSSISDVSTKRDINKLYYSVDGIGELIKRISNNFSTEYDKEIKSIVASKMNKIQLKTSESTFDYDEVVIATEGSTVKKLIGNDLIPTFLSNISYSKCITVHIKCKYDITDNYYAKSYTYSSKPELVVVSKSTVSNTFYIVLNEAFFVYVQDKNYRIIVNNFLKNNFGKEIEILNITLWENALPVFSQIYWNMLRMHKKKYSYKLNENMNLYLAGDYMKGPSTENAAQAGFEVASMLNAKY